MPKSKITWIAVLAIIYASFWIWYGGNGEPISEAEATELIESLGQRHGTDIENAPVGSLPRNIVEMIPNDDGKEFYAVNLERRKAGEDALLSEEKYSTIVLPLLLKRAGHPVFVSERAGLMLGEYGNKVDRVAVVRYRSLRDLIDMAADPAMVEGAKYKYGALEHTEVFITRPTLTAVQIRFMLGLILIIIGYSGLKLIDRIGRS